jgi:hypothetical protein
VSLAVGDGDPVALNRHVCALRQREPVNLVDPLFISL